MLSVTASKADPVPVVVVDAATVGIVVYPIPFFLRKTLEIAPE